MALQDFSIEFASPSEWAAMYRECGLQVIPAKTPQEDAVNYKRPIISWREFETELTPDSTFQRWYGRDGEFRTRSNMGLVTGTASGGVFCVDLDVKDGSQAMEWWQGLLDVHNNGIAPETPSQRTGGGGRQILFRAPTGYVPPTFKTPIGIDIRGQGGFMMAPPSRHGSGKEYEWEDGCAPYEIPFEEAPDWLIEAIENVRLAHGGGATGAKREKIDKAQTANAFGLEDDGREEWLLHAVWGRVVDLYRDCPIRPSEGEQAQARDEIWGLYLSKHTSRITNRPELTKEERLELEGRGRSELDRKWRYAMNKWEKEVKQAASQPRPFGPEEAVAGRLATMVAEEATLAVVEAPGHDIFDPWERYPLPQFPIDCLPPNLRRYVEIQSRSIGVDQSALAMGALAACSGAISHEFRLKIMRTGGWWVRPRLWVMLCGAPSAKKSPAMHAVLSPIKARERENLMRHRKEVAKYEAEKEAGEKPSKPPPPVRFMASDITSEKLGELLSNYDRGLMVEQDEMSQWLGNMEKYSGGKGGADRGFWIQAYNGGGKQVDRIGRGSIYIDNLSISILGGMQPNKIKELGNLTSDGLLQRFIPVMMNDAKRPVEIEDDRAWHDYEVTINGLLDLKPAEQRLDDAAQEEVISFHEWVFDMERIEGLGESFRSFIGKLSGIHGSLMLVLHLAQDPENSVFERVDLNTAKAATRIIKEFVVPHAMALYQETADRVDWEYLRALASFILTSDKERFTASDFTSGVRTLRGLGVWEVMQKVSPLVAGGWLEEEAGSVPARAWTVVKNVRNLLQKRREEELDRKIAVVKAIKELRGGGRQE